MSRPATEVPKALALPSRSSSAPDIIEIVEPAFENTPADTLPSPKLSPVRCDVPLVVPTPCVSEQDSPLAEDADDTAGFSGLLGDNVVDGSELSLPLSGTVEGLILSMSPVLSTPSSPQGLVDLSASPKDDTPTRGTTSDLSTVIPMTSEQVSPSFVSIISAVAPPDFVHSCRRPASFVAGSTSELDPTGAALPLPEDIAIVRRALHEAIPTSSITPLECNDDPSGLSANENARSSSRTRRVDLQQLFQTPSLRQKLKSFSTLYVKTSTVPIINCTLVVKHTSLSLSWILRLSRGTVISSNFSHIETVVPSIPCPCR
ncbi:hypothetical protein NL676_030474 [Syzygium grande]|nr:hypothetical protein NL676_030474 [Syzygium grande]